MVRACVCVCVCENSKKKKLGFFFFKLGKKSPKSHWERGRISAPEDTKKNPCYNTCLGVYYVGVLDPTTNKMMVYDTEKYLLQPHIPGIVLSLYNTPYYNTLSQGLLCWYVRSYYQQDDGV